MRLKELVDKYGDYNVPQNLIDLLEPPQPKSVWELKDGEACVSLDGFGKIASECLWHNMPHYENAREIGNLFLTHEEAKQDIERRKVETLLLKHGGRRHFQQGSQNISLCCHNGRVTTDSWTSDFLVIGLIYFNSAEEARKAIDEIGEERIQAALFDIREAAQAI